jgi:catenin beta 1
MLNNFANSSAPMEAISSYAITTLHNVLLDCSDKVKMHMRKLGAVHQIVPLLASSQNVKFLSIVVDCLQLLAFGNQEAKQVILEMGGTQTLVAILANHAQYQYQKLILNTTRLLKARLVSFFKSQRGIPVFFDLLAPCVVDDSES